LVLKDLSAKSIRINDLAAVFAILEQLRGQRLEVRLQRLKPIVNDGLGPTFLKSLIFRINNLAANSRQIYGFKGLTTKILRNNELALVSGSLE
jgi:hypothetical protein